MASTSTRFAYVGCYTGFTKGQLGWVGTANAGTGITTLEFDEVSGRLAASKHPVVLQDSPTWLEVHPSGKFLVAVHELSHHLGTPEGVGFVTSYKIEPGGALVRVGTQETKGRGNTCACFDRTGKFLLVTRYWDGGITALPFNAEHGTVGPVCSAPQHEGTGPHPLRQSAPHPHGIHGAPDSDMIFAMDLGTDKVHQYRLNTETGVLAHVSDVHMGAESGPRGMVFHPTKPFAYVNNELGGTIVACALGPDGLTPLQTVLCYPAGFVAEGHPHNLGKGKFWAAEAVITQSAAWLYCICRVHHSLAIFKVNADGTLEANGRQALADFSNARNMTLAPSGAHILVASQDADLVEVFKIDEASGALTLTNTADAPCPADVAVV